MSCMCVYNVLGSYYWTTLCDRMRKDDLPGMVFLRKVEELMTCALSGLCLNSSFGFPEQVGTVGTGQSLNHHKRNFVIFYLRNSKHSRV